MAKKKTAPAPTVRHEKVEHKRVNIEVSAKSITTSHNPRMPLPKLQMMGYQPIRLFTDWVTNGDADQRAEYCKLIEDHEPDIVGLAASIKCGEEQRGYGQLQAILLRPFRVKTGTDTEVENGDARNVYETRYGLIAGERRMAANRYNFAKHGLDLPLMAIAIECTKDEAYDMAIEENLNRLDPNELEYGAMYLWYNTTKPRLKTDGTPELDTDGKPVLGWSIPAIAEKFHRQVGHIRGRMACATPGKLTPEQIQGYMDGKIKITRLVEIATGQKPYKNPLEPHHRRGVRTLAEVRKRFDDLNKDEDKKDFNDFELRQLAWFMLYPLDKDGQDVSEEGFEEACKDSKARINAAPAEPIKPKKKTKKKVAV